MTGGRGFSIWTLTGEFVWDDGGEIERKAAAAGLYPDTRSENNGIEIEGHHQRSFWRQRLCLCRIRTRIISGYL